MKRATPNPRLTQKAPQEVRCTCGQLIAKITPNGIEIKCRRCKHVHILPLDGPIT